MWTDRVWAWAAAVILTATGRAQTTQGVSIGFQASGPSSVTAISADGRYVAFTSAADNLVPGDTNGKLDVFVHDRQTGAIERVSVRSDGAEGNGDSGSPHFSTYTGYNGISISADGRFVAFTSYADDLVVGDTNHQGDVFLRDRWFGTTERISVDSSGAQLFWGGSNPAVSADGRYVAFETESDIGPGDTNGWPDVYIRDRQSGTTELVSVSSAGVQGNGSSGYNGLCISADARYVAFESDATTLVPGDINDEADVFVRDRSLGTTEIVNVGPGGLQANASSADYGLAISGDGRFVAFSSFATDLVPGDTNAWCDVFVRDRLNGTTERVSLSSTAVQGNGPSGYYGVAISGDGRFVAFQSFASTLVPGDTNGVGDVLVRDRQLGTTERISLDSGGTQGNQVSGDLSMAISSDGRYVAFASDASNLVPGDTNGATDVLVRDRLLGRTERASGRESGNSFSLEPAISADGYVVVFKTNADNYVPGDTNGFYDVYAYDRRSGATERVSVSTGGGEGNGPSELPSVSSDGRYVSFDSAATNLVAGDTNVAQDVFLRDRQSGTTERVSVGAGGAEANSNSFSSSVSSDGRYVAFSSYASNLVAGDTNGTMDVFVRDRQAGTTERVSVASGGAQADQVCQYPAISADGRYVAFMSGASTLVAGDTNGLIDIFVHDRQSGTTERVSVDSSGAQSNGDSYGAPAISADGRYVAFASDASNLIVGDTNATGDIFVRDRQTGTTTRVSLTNEGAEANGGSYGNPSISANGRYVAFPSYATNFVAGDTNGYSDVFLRDRLAGTTERLSIATDGTQGNRDSYAPSISGDGRCIAFTSEAWTLVDEDVNLGYRDVFVRDRGPGSAFASFCAGDGTIAACPCGNSGAAGHGCENSSTTGGALLAATGNASLSADTVHLTSSGEKPTTISVVLQGSLAISPLHYGDGLRCVGGTLKRLLSHNAVGGVVTIPQGADPALSARSAALGDVIQPGATRNYQIYYRDPSATFCPTPTGSTFNISNAIAIAWSE